MSAISQVPGATAFVLTPIPDQNLPMRYETTMAQVGNNTGIPVPLEVLDALGGGRRPAVALTVNGLGYRSTVGSMGGEFLVPFSSALRA